MKELLQVLRTMSPLLMCVLMLAAGVSIALGRYQNECATAHREAVYLTRHHWMVEEITRPDDQSVRLKLHCIDNPQQRAEFLIRAATTDPSEQLLLTLEVDQGVQFRWTGLPKSLWARMSRLGYVRIEPEMLDTDGDEQDVLNDKDEIQ